MMLAMCMAAGFLYMATRNYLELPLFSALVLWLAVAAPLYHHERARLQFRRRLMLVAAGRWDSPLQGLRRGGRALAMFYAGAISLIFLTCAPLFAEPASLMLWVWLADVPVLAALVWALRRLLHRHLQTPAADGSIRYLALRINAVLLLLALLAIQYNSDIYTCHLDAWTLIQYSYSAYARPGYWHSYPTGLFNISNNLFPWLFYCKGLAAQLAFMAPLLALFSLPCTYGFSALVLWCGESVRRG